MIHFEVLLGVRFLAAITDESIPAQDLESFLGSTLTLNAFCGACDWYPLAVWVGYLLHWETHVLRLS